MKRLTSMGCAMVCTSLILTGCGDFDAMPDLTKEESALIAEVSAGLLAQSDKNAGTLVKDWAIIAHDEREAVKKANLEKVLAQKAEAEALEAEKGENGKGSGNGEGTDVEPFSGIAAFCRQDAFDISYAGMFFTSSYPEDGDPADALFNVTADGNNKLMVVQFTAVNMTDEEQVLDLFDSGVTFKLGVSSSSPRSVLTTLLPDDMSMYEGKVPAKESVNLVLIQELSPGERENGEDLVLVMQNMGGATTSTLLQAGSAMPQTSSESASENGGEQSDAETVPEQSASEQSASEQSTSEQSSSE